MVRFLGRLPIKIVEYSEYIDGAPSEGTVPAGSGPHSPIWPHSLACWSIKLQNSIVAAAELQLSAYMHRKASSAVTWPLDSRPPSHFTTPLPTATRVPDEERSIERRTRRGGKLKYVHVKVYWYGIRFDICLGAQCYRIIWSPLRNIRRP